MSKNNIVDLSLYRKKKGQAASDSKKGPRSFEERLKDLMYRPFKETESQKELMAIFEDQKDE